jgi:hypothetical protein
MGIRNEQNRVFFFQLSSCCEDIRGADSGVLSVSVRDNLVAAFVEPADAADQIPCDKSGSRWPGRLFAQPAEACPPAGQLSAALEILASNESYLRFLQEKQSASGPDPALGKDWDYGKEGYLRNAIPNRTALYATWAQKGGTVEPLPLRSQP